jgi:IclR family acetate operon transcriptional repressor
LSGFDELAGKPIGLPGYDDRQEVCVAVNRTAPEPRSGGGGRDDGNVRSIQRAIHVLTTLAEHPYPLGLLELAGYVGLSRASVHRILMTLVSVGWVEQNPRTTKYRLGMGAVGVGIVGMVTNPLIRDSYLYLTRLSEWSGHDSVLSTLVGGKTVQLRRAAGVNTELIDFEAGHPQPAYAMADGKLLLSYLDEAEAESLLRSEEMRAFTTSTITDVSTMLRELDTIRNQGFAVDNFERFEAGRGLAVPVMGEGDLPVASMLALGRLDPARDEETIQQMQSLARGLSDRLKSAGELPKAAYEAYYAAPRRPLES